MTFLAPGFFFASLAVAAAIVTLHFIVTRQPRAAILPTARFVPDTRATTVARARRPADVPLMLLRVLTVLAAGAGLAKPVLTPSRGAEARVILVDVSRSARDSTAIRDSVGVIYRDGDAVVVFDSSARMLTGNVVDTLGGLAPTTRRGNLSAALIAALRAGSILRDRADSVELVMVSPFAKEEFDAATDSIRTLWPGRARLVRVGQPAPDTSRVRETPVVQTDANNPLLISVAQAQVPGTRYRILIDWPSSSRPRFAVSRNQRDTVGGVMTSESRVVSTFERRWIFPADSLRGADVIARWVDGEPAAIEKPDATGCMRSVAIPVTPVGDFVIRKDFVRFVSSLSHACTASTSLVPADPNAIAKLAGRGGLAPRTAFEPLTDARSNLAPWLLALALASAIAELFLRRRRKGANELRAADQLSAAGKARAA
jgi:aerotolerance regulator-like protein